MKVFALVDCNNFYASCERLFNPSLRKVPLVILSNNDGCVIARSYEAKDIGIKMGEPVFKCEYLINRHKVAMRSANFTLYSDLSQRVMSCIEEVFPELEVYSIDEAFFVFASDNIGLCIEQAWVLKNKIEREIGIPVSIGIAQTKTLAKVANKIAKSKKLGVFSLYFSAEDEDYNQARLDYHLNDYAIEDVWGLGYNYCKFLRRYGFSTALDFKYADRRWVRQEMKVQGLRTCMELSGIECIPMESYSNEEENTKSIISSRSFGTRVRSLDFLKEAMANFVAIACYKMRRSKKVTRCLQIMLRGIDKDSESYSYEKNWHGYRVDNVAILDAYTNSTSKLINAAQKAVEEIFDPKLYYKKAGVVFVGLKDENAVQIPLFIDGKNFIDNFARNNKVNKLVDTINDNIGDKTLFWASMGNTTKVKKKENWRAQQQYRSPCYTTKWSDLAGVY